MSDMQVNDQLPTLDEALGQHEQSLPTLDEAMEKLPSLQSNIGATVKNALIPEMFRDMTPEPSELSDAQRTHLMMGQIGNITKAFGKGYSESIDNDSGLSPETVTALANAGLSKQYAETMDANNKSFMDGIMLPTVNAFSRHVTLPVAGAIKAAAWDLPNAIIAGSMEAAAQTGREANSAALESDLPGMLEYGLIMSGFEKPVLPRPIAQAKAAGVLDGEAVYFGTKEPPPSAAKAMNEAAVMYPEITPEQAVTAPAAASVHDYARATAPQIFKEYDDLTTQRELYAGQLRELRTKHQEDLIANAPHNEEIAALQKKVEFSKRSRGEEGKIAELEDKNKEWIDSQPESDALIKAREDYQKTDYRMRDMSPDVSAAYREAEDLMPKPAEAQTEQPLLGSDTDSPVTKVTPEQKSNIVKAESDKLVAAGRPAEEAQAGASLVAEHYAARSERFGGKLGTAEEMYARDAADIVAGKDKNTKSSGMKGKLRVAENDLKSTITLMKRADSSTFVHEQGHHWLEELIRDSKHKDAPEMLKKDSEAVLKYVGADADGKIPTKGHEKFARSFERYLMEGVAPSKELAGIFAQFKEWLTKLYQVVDNLKAPINDDIRAVFDRLLSANPERTVIAEDRIIPPWEKPPEPTPALVESTVASATPAADGPAAAQMLTAPPEQPAPRVTAQSAEPAPKVEVKPNPEDPNAVLGVADDGLVDKAGNIRLDNLNTPESVNQVLRDIAEQNDQFMTARRGTLSDAEVLNMADALGMSPDKLDTRKMGEAFNAEQIVAARKLLIQSATELRDHMAKAAVGDDAAVLAYAEARSRHLMIQEQVSGLTAEAGRALRAFRQLEGGAEAGLLSDFLKQNTGKDLYQLKQEATLGAELETAQQLSKFINDNKGATTTEKAIFIWINALLSGPVTHVKNIIGNMSVAVYSVAETAAAERIGQVRRAITGSTEGVAVGEAEARLFGLFKGSREGIVAAAKYFKNGDEMSMGHTVEGSHVNPIGGMAGKIIGAPTKALGAEDELFKAIAMRQEINALSFRTATEEGLKGDALNQRMYDLIDKPTEEMMAQAVKHAEYQTYTRALGKIGRSVQTLSNSHPLLKIVIPFVRTPTNILKYAGERTPLGLISAEIRDNLMGKNGAVAQDTQIARLALGTTLGLTTLGLAAEGLITGGGPSNPKDKAMLRMTGWQPYSIKVGNTYYSYNWLDPFSTIMGVSADMHDLVKSGQADEKDAAEIGALLFGGISKSIMSKLSLRGVSDLIQAVSDPDRYGGSYLQGLAATVVPSAVNQVGNSMDPIMRQTTSAIDAIKSRIPIVRESLLPVRDMWGQPITRDGSLGPDVISPVYESRMKNDPVNKQMVAIGMSPSKPSRKIMSVELTDKQYDDYSRIAGIQAKNILNGIVPAAGFSAIPEEQQKKIIQNVIDQSRENARKAVMAKYPDIMKQAIDNKRRAITGSKD